MPTIVDLAKDILRHAEELQASLDAANVPHPSLDAGAPPQYPDRIAHADIYSARAKLVDASRDMFQLALGPTDTLRTMIGPERCTVSVLRVIGRYNIPSIVSKHGGSVSFADLAREIGVDAGALERILRLGFAVNLFKEEPRGFVTHTALTEAFPVIEEWIMLNVRDDMSKAILSWDGALRAQAKPEDGGRQLAWNIGNQTDRPFFDTFAAIPEDSKLFSAAMTAAARSSGGLNFGLFVDGYDWAKYGEGPIVDLGGGNGYISAAIAKGAPKLRIVVQDLPVNEASYRETVPDELKERVTYQVQDFFEPQTKQLGAKAYFMKSIMHDWPDADAAKILRHLMPDVEKGAKIVILDRALADAGHRPTHDESLGLFMDCLMFTLLGAKERSRAQWEELFRLTDDRLRITGWAQPVGSEFACIELGI